MYWICVWSSNRLNLKNWVAPSYFLQIWLQQYNGSTSSTANSNCDRFQFYSSFHKVDFRVSRPSGLFSPRLGFVKFGEPSKAEFQNLPRKLKWLIAGISTKFMSRWCIFSYCFNGDFSASFQGCKGQVFASLRTQTSLSALSIRWNNCQEGLQKQKLTPFLYREDFWSYKNLRSPWKTSAFSYRIAGFKGFKLMEMNGNGCFPGPKKMLFVLVHPKSQL